MNGERGRIALDAGEDGVDEVVLATHFGPSTATTGGMAAVLRQYAAVGERSAGALRFAFVSTWVPGSVARRARVFVGAMRVVLRRDRRALGVVHVHVAQGGSYARKGLLLEVARRRGLVTCATVHGSGSDVYIDDHPHRARALLARCDAVAVLSRDVERRVRALVGPSVPVRLLPNRVPIPESTPLPGRLRVLYAGVVSRRKGVNMLLDVWPAVAHAVPGASLTLVGPSRDIDVPRLPGVHYLGTVPRRQVGRLLEESDVAVLPSLAEGMPMFVLEAMATGRPVVTTAIADLPAVVGDGGVVVPPGDAGALREALTALLADPERAAETGRTARRRAIAGHDLRDLAAELRDLYASAHRARADARLGARTTTART